MRSLTFFPHLFWVIGVLVGGAALAAAPKNLQHPGEVALGEGAGGVLVYRAFPSNMRLYYYDDDAPGKSNCNLGCSSAWPPVLARETAKPLGDWTIVIREDGRRQWAYKGRPVYIRFHDSVTEPTGDGHEGKWHLLDP